MKPRHIIMPWRARSPQVHLVACGERLWCGFDVDELYDLPGKHSYVKLPERPTCLVCYTIAALEFRCEHDMRKYFNSELDPRRRHNLACATAAILRNQPHVDTQILRAELRIICHGGVN